MFEAELYLSFAFVSFVLFLLEITGAALFMGNYAYVFLVMSMVFYVVHFVERFVVNRHCPHPHGVGYLHNGVVMGPTVVGTGTGPGVVMGSGVGQTGLTNGMNRTHV